MRGDMQRPLLTRGFEERDRHRIVALLREYEADTGTSLCFQNFAGELEGLPGDYAPSGGVMIFAREPAGEELVGCVALRPVPGARGSCEMKRLYVRASARGSGLGRTLALAVMAEARRIGYARICLDTLPGMRAAQDLYRALGFRQTGVAQSDRPVLLFARELGTQP